MNDLLIPNMPVDIPADSPFAQVDEISLREKLLTWLRSLNAVERVAVTYYLTTGSTKYIDAFRPESEKLQAFVFKPFADADTELLS